MHAAERTSMTPNVLLRYSNVDGSRSARKVFSESEVESRLPYRDPEFRKCTSVLGEDTESVVRLQCTKYFYRGSLRISLSRLGPILTDLFSMRQGSKIKLDSSLVVVPQPSALDDHENDCSAY